MNFNKNFKTGLFIILGSVLYALSTVLFIFPHSLLLGGTSGISVILNSVIPFSPGAILMIINFSLIILAFVILGKDMAVKTLIGSVATTVFVGLFERIFVLENPLIENLYISAIVGAFIIAVSSGVLFYIDSSSGGTDIIALIVKKFSSIKIGKALLLTDVLIVVIGGILSSKTLLISSFLGLVIKTFGIDFIISFIKKLGKGK